MRVLHFVYPQIKLFAVSPITRVVINAQQSKRSWIIHVYREFSHHTPRLDYRPNIVTQVSHLSLLTVIYFDCSLHSVKNNCPVITFITAAAVAAVIVVDVVLLILVNQWWALQCYCHILLHYMYILASLIDGQYRTWPMKTVLYIWITTFLTLPQIWSCIVLFGSPFFRSSIFRQPHIS